jgi:hypothetical protein
MRWRRAASALEMHHGSVEVCISYNAKRSCAPVSRMSACVCADTLTLYDPQSKSPCTELHRAVEPELHRALETLRFIWLHQL